MARGDRHYVFDPTRDEENHLAGEPQRVVLDRSAVRPSGLFRFRLYEQRDRVHHATLMVRGNLTRYDEVDLQLNGVPLATGPLGKHDDRYLRPFPNVRWFPVPAAATNWGENQLTITLASADPGATGEMVIDEVEIWVEPR